MKNLINMLNEHGLEVIGHSENTINVVSEYYNVLTKKNGNEIVEINANISAVRDFLGY